MAKGPGVDSLTAMKLSISSVLIQPRAVTSDCMSGIMAYPPPKVKAPIFINVQISSR